MNHTHRPNRLSALLLGAAAVIACASAQAQEAMARVLTSTAVMQQVAVPRQVCTNQQVIQQSQPSGAGAAMGAIAGGALGNAMGGGSGRDLATVIGLFGGAVLGNKIEGTRDEVRNVQQCSTQTTYENRVLHYDVIYEYEGRRYSIKMPNDPGQFVRLQLNPVGAMPAPSYNAPSSNAPASTIFTPISSLESQPQQVYQAYPSSNVTIVQPAPVYITRPVVHSAPPFVYYQPTRPIHQPYVAPIGLSLQWSNGYNRHHNGHGDRRHPGHQGHWR
jgi:uncharacterized protein YcfJ